jgi:hypothetical protein
MSTTKTAKANSNKVTYSNGEPLENNGEEGNTVNITITQTPPPRGSKGNNVEIQINQLPEA